ncbi:cysteine--tRNA ligase [Effusibacillus pohliae]|uniref:cysteine--tRNA ligase n=1 Tax=Effusibacillus pohliae TaxID=232270 RepID=UPI000380F287|nr:cysteine--tRNA ligase [Effusibacillus pohliae]
MIRIYNTLTREKEEFIPQEPGKVRMYVCGPTVYNYFHIGNARPFLFFDVVRRYLEYRGFQVKYVQNFTDVDDKIIRVANEEGVHPQVVADRFVEAYFQDAERLGIRRADAHPRVTGHIRDIIAMIGRLIDKGYAYVADGDVYYSTDKFPDYGKLSKQPIDDLLAGARIEVSEKKRNPLDFTLWKAAKPGEVSWPSPWGEGRPGWHIECSAMSKKYLGETLDIHAGGHDLIFPHHENEIAQSEAANGKPFARYWMHNGYININNEKMSKSLGNFVLVHDLLERYDARVIRFFLLSAHYRNPINFSAELMEQAAVGLERIDTAIANLNHCLASAEQGDAGSAGIDPAGLRAKFIKAMDDDFNTADAIATIFELVREANSYLHGGQAKVAGVKAYRDALVELVDVLGLTPAAQQDQLAEEVERLIQERTQARKDRDFKRADEIRDQLAAMGIILEDTPQGVRWKRK